MRRLVVAWKRLYDILLHVEEPSRDKGIGKKGAYNIMSERIASSEISYRRACLAVGLALGLSTAVPYALAQETPTADPAMDDNLLLSTTEEEAVTETVVETGFPSTTPSFDELDSAASDLNEALSGARAKLDELRQATELAAMAAELREELEQSIQENNRLAASLADVQSERSELETRQNTAEQELLELRKSVDSSKIEIERQQQRLEQRETRIAEIETAQTDADDQIHGLEGDLSKANREISELGSKIAELTGELETTRAELDEVNGEAQQARTARDGANRELAKVRMQIAGMLRSVLLGGEPIDVSDLEDADSVDDLNASLGLGARYETIRSSNVRAAPSPDSERVGFAEPGDVITVIGKVDGRNWFEIETADGLRGFIFGDLIRPAA